MSFRYASPHAATTCHTSNLFPVHVSASPPLIPDGRFSRIRLAATAFPQGPSQYYPMLKRLPAYTPVNTV